MKTGAILEFKVAKMVDDMKQKAEEHCHKLTLNSTLLHFRNEEYKEFGNMVLRSVGRRSLLSEHN